MMVVQALIKLGSNSGIGNHQGIWPAFWALGASELTGTGWPACGEWDIMENVNGGNVGYGTLHCGDTCNGFTGLSAAVDFNYNAFHTWAFAVDMTNSDWTQQQLRWYLDGNLYHTIRGSDLGNQADWEAVTKDPYYLILNIAVGGNLPGAPSAATADGAASGMEVSYVGVYASV
jgi:beta-glucanase (GH16 family)